MKALLRNSAGLLALLLIGSVSNGYYWVTPVLKQPYPVAPSPSNSGFYLMDAYGRWTGPHYYLVPPCPPFNGILPGPIGAAIGQGYLPHDLLMSKDNMKLGPDVPILGQKKQAPEAPQHAAAGPPSNGPPQQGYGMGNGGPSPYQPYPQYAAMPNSNVQVPYGYVPNSPYPLQPAYIQPPLPQPMPQYGMMPYTMPQYGMMPQYGRMPYPMPYGTPPTGMMPQQQPMMPPQGRPIAWQDPRTGVWRVQNVVPNLPTAPAPPMNPVQQFNQFSPFSPIQGPQGPQPPRMDMAPMQLPRMEMTPPPRPIGGMSYPSHPFTRSPRDFFMWGDMMEEERARSRPLPVP